MTASPTFILAATPTTPSRLKKFFESGDASVRPLLENPGELRYAGWDLQTADTAKIVRGEYLEVKNGDKILHLYEDGTFIVRAAADGTFLAWGNSKTGDPKNVRLHPMALIEFTYRFADFYARLVPHFETLPKVLRMRVELQDAIVDDAKLFLSPYTVGSRGWAFNEEPHFFAPDPRVKREIDVKTSKLQQSPPRVAYQLIQQVYLWFGISPDRIPYTAMEGENRIIDVAQIGTK